ncbi:hypothetical protein [Amycolatopsis nalaikhensis]|uniref:Uncharacterized protein n=1 Tax=Amycolatopsis nalaikhensis TaxID=715472 RepID=A0ABY8XY83_9PSEU|nr:hypothetical protein [Amycolatopsis sp. 2-2]WIV60679.1 hypothetical protein QP939_19735 [Amycolatopsis sp. 2-2]
MTDDEWHPTTPRRRTDPVKAVVLVVGGLGCCILLWALALMVVFAADLPAPAAP